MVNTDGPDGSYMKRGSFSEFLKENGEAILEVAGKELIPLFSGAARDIAAFDIAGVASGATRRPKGRQAFVAMALATGLLRGEKQLLLNGETGSGKTYVTLLAHQLAGNIRRTLIVCPPQINSKWRKEILMDIPDARIITVEKGTEFECIIAVELIYDLMERKPDEVVDLLQCYASDPTGVVSRLAAETGRAQGTIERVIRDKDLAKDPAGTVNWAVSRGPLFVILDRERTRNTYWRNPSYVMRRSYRDYKIDSETEESVEFTVRPPFDPDSPPSILCCPACSHRPGRIESKTQTFIPYSVSDLMRRETYCTNEECGEALWQASSSKGRWPRGRKPVDADTNDPRHFVAINRYATWDAAIQDGTAANRSVNLMYSRNRKTGAVSDGKRISGAAMVKRGPRGFFDLLVADEVHEYKAGESAQGLAVGTLANICGSTIGLTGTLMGGYASTLFFLLFRLSPEVRAEFTPDGKGLARWIKRYGLVKKVEIRRSAEGDVTGQGSKKKEGVRVKELPGVMPEILMRLLGGTAFLHLADVDTDLPSYNEYVVQYKLDNTVHEGDPMSQQQGYQELESAVTDAVIELFQSGDMRPLAKLMRALLAYPDSCIHGEKIPLARVLGDGSFEMDMLVDVPPLSADVIYPKEQALIDLAVKERDLGRKLLAYVCHTGIRDITGRTRKILEDAGLKVAVLKANTVDVRDRARWISEQVAEGIDVLVCHPKLVQTGMDLYAFPSIVWFETEYSTYVMGQASKRAFRVGQTQDCRTYYFAYGDSMQSDALSLCAKKMQVSLAVEGKLDETAMTTLAEESGETYLALARRLIKTNSDHDLTAEQVEESSEEITGMFAKIAAQAAAEDTSDTSAPEDYVGDAHSIDWDEIVRSIEVGTAEGTEDETDPEEVGGVVVTPVVIAPVSAGAHEMTDDERATFEELAALFSPEAEASKKKRRKPQRAAMSLFEYTLGQY